MKAYPGETVVLKGDWSISFQGANWWTLEGLIFDQPQRQYIQLGLHQALGHDRTVAAEHITIRNCEFKNGTSAVIPVHYANDVLIENNYFHHVRPGTPFYDAQGNQIGWELNAIDVRYMADDIVIRNNRFEEMGSDGVQLGSQSYREGSHIGSVSIINNEFWVNRPYQGILGNVSENAIDIKKVSGPILVSGNTIHGFRPTTPQQDASGADGDGLTIHLDAQNVIVERNLFYDNTMHITVTKNSQNIVIRNNILRDSYPYDHPSAGTGILVYESTGVQILHNTFFNNQNHIKGYSEVVTTGVLKNNVFWRGGFYVPSPGGAWDWDADYNAWSEITGGVPAPLRGSHDVLNVDLQLDQELKPTENSPLIDAGTDVGVTDDFARNARSDGTPDMGAREWRWSNLMVHAVHIVPSHIQPK